MTRNPLGYVNVADGGAPRILSALCSENVSGGNFVQYSGAAGNVSSGLNSFVTSDICVINDGTGSSFGGIALFDQLSGTTNYVSFATRGLFILTSAGTVVAGQKVSSATDHAVVPFAGSASAINIALGRAVTSAGSEQWCIVDLGGV